MELVAAFLAGNTGTTSRNREYYILGRGDGRVLMHKTRPLAMFHGDIKAGTAEIFLNSYSEEKNNTEIGIRKFLTDREAHKEVKIQTIEPIVFIQGLISLSPQDLQVLKENINKFGESEWSRELLQELDNGPTPSFNSPEERGQAFKKSKLTVQANFLDNRNKLEKLLLEGVSTPEEVVQAFAKLKPLVIAPQVIRVLQKLNGANSPFVKGVYDFIMLYGVQSINSYYDIANQLKFKENVDLSQVDLNADFESNIKPVISEQEVSLYDAYIHNLSSAYERLAADKFLQDAYLRVNEPDFFSIMTRLNKKQLTDMVDGGSQQALLTNDNPDAMKSYISQISAWTMQLFGDVKMKAIRVLSQESAELKDIPLQKGEKPKKPQPMAYYASKALDQEYETLNNALGSAIETVMNDPEVQSLLGETSAISEDLISTLIKTDGGLKEKVQFNPKQPLTGLLKEFLSAAFKFRGIGLGTAGESSAFRSTSPDIFKYQAFANSIINEDLAKKIRGGYTWSGMFIEEYASAAVRSGQPIEIPLGTIAYYVEGGGADKQMSRKTILGNGQILRVEVDDNFLRFSVHSYHATLNGQQRQTEVKRMIELKREMYRMHSEIANVLTATGVEDKIMSKVIEPNDADKEMKKYIKKGMLNTFIVNSGGTASLSQYHAHDFFDATGIATRGFTYYQLTELYAKIESGKAKEKFADSIFQYELKDTISALERYIAICVQNGDEEIAKLKDSGVADLRVSSWVNDEEFYKNNIIVDICYGVGDQFQFGVKAFYPLFGKYITPDGKGVRPSRPFFSRRAVHPKFVSVSLLEGVSNVGNDLLTHAQKNLPVYNKLLKEFNSLVSKNGTKFEMEEDDSPTMMPMMHQGPIMTDLKTIIEDSKRRYVNPVGRTVTIPIDDVLQGGLAEKYADYFDADYHIQYHKDLDGLLNEINAVYEKNLALAALMNISNETFTMEDNDKKLQITFMDQFDKALSEKFGVTLVEQVRNQLKQGTVAIRDIVTNTDRFMNSVQSPEGVPLDKIKDKYTDSLLEVLQGVYSDTLETIKKASDASSLSGSTRETNAELSKFQKKMESFETLRGELREASKRLMGLLGKYGADKGMLLDMIKSGRVLNQLLSTEERAKKKDVRDQEKMDSELGTDGEDQ